MRIIRTSTLAAAEGTNEGGVGVGDAGAEGGASGGDSGENGEGSESGGESPDNTETSAAPVVRRRGRPPRNVTVAVAAPTTQIPTLPAATSPLPQLDAKTLQGLGLLFVMAKSMNVPTDKAAEILRAALDAYALVSPRS